MHCPTACFHRTVFKPETPSRKSVKKIPLQPADGNGKSLFITQERSKGRTLPGNIVLRWAIYACLMILLCPSILPAAQVTLAWDPNSTSADGYNVYQRKDGEEYDYNSPVWGTDGGTNVTSCTIDGLAEDVTYYFVVRACSGPTESNNSNEVVFRALSNRSPVAMTGGNQQASAGSAVKLEGAGSYDQDGDSLTYHFLQTSGPAVDLNCSGTQCTFTAPEVFGRTTALTFELTVGDGNGLFDTATTIVLVNPPNTKDAAGVDDGTPDGNRGPGLPALMAPGHGETNIEIAPWIRTSAFHDPDGDTHVLTQWHITDAATGTEIMDLISIDRNLTDLQVPQLILEPMTQYAARVRFFDHLGRSSQWSEPAIFTLGEDMGDLNKNRIPDNLEVSQHTDMNSDAIPDNEQSNIIKSVSIKDGLYLAGVSIENSVNAVGIGGVTSVDPNTLDIAPDPGVSLPVGLLHYKIEVAQPGDSVDVTLYLSEPLDSDLVQWTRYDIIEGWQNSSATTVVDAEGFVVERSLKDGGEEDGDGVANGIIIDMSGPLYGPNHSSSLTGADDGPASPGGGGGGCFIGSIFGTN